MQHLLLCVLHMLLRAVLSRVCLISFPLQQRKHQQPSFALHCQRHIVASCLWPAVHCTHCLISACCAHRISFSFRVHIMAAQVELWIFIVNGCIVNCIGYSNAYNSWYNPAQCLAMHDLKEGGTWDKQARLHPCMCMCTHTLSLTHTHTHMNDNNAWHYKQQETQSNQQQWIVVFLKGTPTRLIIDLINLYYYRWIINVILKILKTV